MKNKLLLLNIIIFFIILSVFVFGFLSFNKTVKGLKSLSEEVLQENSKKEQVSNLISDFAKSKEDIDFVSSSLVSSGGEVSIIEYIEGLAKQMGLNIEISSVLIEKENELTPNNLSNLVLNIKVSGNWRQVFNFLGLLESIPYKISIDKMSFVYTNDGDKSKEKIGLWEGVFTVKILKKNE